MLLIFIAGSALRWAMSKAMSSLIFAMDLRFCYPYIAIPVLLVFVGVLLFGFLLVWVLVWFGAGVGGVVWLVFACSSKQTS